MSASSRSAVEMHTNFLVFMRLNDNDDVKSIVFDVTEPISHTDLTAYKTSFPHSDRMILLKLPFKLPVWMLLDAIGMLTRAERYNMYWRGTPINGGR